MGGLEGAGRWQQVSLWCADWQATEKVAITHLGPQLTAAEIITLWWFVRKGASWRVRCLPVPGRDEQMSLVLKQTMRDLVTGGSILCWTMTTTYEPETHAFGGPDGMDLAHQLFHADSRHLLSHLRQARDNYRRELGLRLANQLMLAAGQDWYEQGDVWARVAAHRLTGQPPPESKTAMAAVHRLMTAPLNSSHSPLAAAPDWLAAFQRAGHGLAGLAHQGRLTRGLRAVLAHHVLFAWNRAGISAQQQGLMAATAAQVVFHSEPAPSPAGTAASSNRQLG